MPTRLQGSTGRLLRVLTSPIFKANDIRGIVGGGDAEWDTAGAKALGRAYVELFGLAGQTFVMSRDMRTSGPELSKAFASGATEGGASVIDVGLASTDGLWFCLLYTSPSPRD